eukprot:9365023-Prorocentrum_lima.AAC.1
MQQLWASRLRTVVNKQLSNDRDDWLSSLSKAAVEGPKKQQFIAQRSSGVLWSCRPRAPSRHSWRRMGSPF